MTVRLKLHHDAAKVEAVQSIPGLHVAPSGEFCFGPPDAVAAACLALGREPPVVRFPEPVEDEGLGLRDYQRAGVAFLCRTLEKSGGAILADDMGLGKTLQALVTMRKLAPASRGLVVCPAAARETWRDELAKWGFKNSVVLSPSQTKKSKAEWERAGQAQIVVCSYDHRMVERAMDAGFSLAVPEFVILDEAHRVRGRTSLRSKALENVLAVSTYKLAVTATPQYDRPRDFYQLLKMLFGRRFGSKFDFDSRYCGWTPYTSGGTGLNTGATHSDELQLRLRYVMLRREKGEVAKELPALTRQVRWVEPTPEAKKAFQALQMGLRRATLIDAMKATLKGKAEEAMALAADAKRFLLVTWMREHAHQFTKVLNERGTPCVCVTGDEPTEKRAATLKLARAKGMGVVGTLDSLSESLNLQGLASIGIMHHIDYVPLKMAQAEGRLHRLGTVDPVLWYYIAMQQSVDTHLVKTVVEKLDAWRGVMGAHSHRELRNALGDHVDGAGAEKAEAALLKQIYESLEDDDE